MATDRSFGNMLQQNIYSALQKEDRSSRAVASERERLRNNIIDRTGMKPSGPQLNSLLAQKAATSVLKKKR